MFRALAGQYEVRFQRHHTAHPSARPNAAPTPYAATPVRSATSVRIILWRTSSPSLTAFLNQLGRHRANVDLN